MTTLVKVQPDGLTWALERTNVASGGVDTTGHAIWSVVPPRGSYILSVRAGGAPVGNGTVSATSLRVSYDARLPSTMASPEDVEVVYQAAATGEKSITITGIPLELDGVTPVRVRFDVSSTAPPISVCVQGTMILHPAGSEPVKTSAVASATVP